MSDNNWQQWLAAGTAFGVGAGTSLHQTPGGIKQAYQNVIRPSIKPVMTAEQNIAQQAIQNIMREHKTPIALRNIQKRASLSRLESLEKRLNKQNKIPGMQGAIAREWEAAKNAVLPTGMEIPTWSVDSDNPFEGVRKALQGKSDVYTQNIFRRFAANVETLSRTGTFGDLTDVSKRVDIPHNLLASPARISDPNLVNLAEEIGDVIGEKLTVTRKYVGTVGELSFKGLISDKELFSLPETFGTPGMKPGLARTGQGLHNIYAPGMFSYVDEAGKIGEAMSFTEFKAKEMLATAKKAMSNRTSVQAAFASRSEELSKFMDFMEPSLGGEDFSLETVAKSQRLTVIDESGKAVKGAQAQGILERYGNLTPTSKAGRFQTIAPSKLYGGFSELIDYARKPWQWMRQYAPSEGAQAAMAKSKYGSETFDFLDSPMARERFSGPSAPRLKTLYLSTEQLGILESLGFPVGDGELLVNERMNRQAEVTRTRRVALKSVADDLTSRMVKGTILSGDEQVPLLLGRADTGELVSTSPGTRIKDISATPMRGPGGTKVAGYNVLLEETIKMGEFEKRFGGLKGMARSVRFKTIAGSRELQELTGFSAKELLGFGAIGRLDDISAKKDPALRAMQKFSAIVSEAQARPGLPGAQQLLSDPMAAMARINKASNVGDELVSLAESVGVGSGTSSYDRIFGDKVAYGISRLHFGGPKEFTGAGKMGTVEPRILNLLQGRGDEIGQELGQNLISRVTMADPDRLTIHDELRKTFASMVEDAKAIPGLDITDEATDIAKLRKEGDYIKTGIPQMSSIYMPGYEDISKFAPYKVGEFMTETAPIQKTFRDIEDTVRATISGDLTPEKALAKFNDKGGYFTQLFQEFAPAGKGQGSLARGQVFGSRFLTAVSGKSEFYDDIARLGLGDAPVIGIPKSMGAEMIEELSQYGMDTGDMLERFQKGEAIGGAVARHPFIGAYSAQPVHMIATAAESPEMFIPEPTVTARFAGIDKEARLTGGILQGMALDKDADIAMAIALDGGMEAKVRAQLAGAANPQMAAYAQHTARMQLLKAKGADAGQAAAALTRSEQIAAAGTKLGIVDDYVGRVSSQLSTARAAVVSSSLDSGAQTRALGLLEWLEQQPISGKHLSESKVLKGTFQKQMEAIIAGASGDAGLLENTVRNMATGPTAERLLGSGLDVVDEMGAPSSVRLLGQNLSRIEGFELETTSRQIAEAVKGFKGATAGGSTRAQIENFLRPGRGAQLSRHQIPSMLEAANVMKTKAQSGMKEWVKRQQASLNKGMAQVSARTRPLAKPLLAGLTAASAAAFMFSGAPTQLQGTPPRSDTVGKMPPVQANIGRSNRDDMSIPDLGSQVLGEPTASNLISNRSVVLDEEQADRSRDMRMRISAQNLTAMQRRELSSRLNSRFPGVMDINVRDSRRSLNQHVITDMLE